jgi:hypothetical protein
MLAIKYIVLNFFLFLSLRSFAQDTFLLKSRLLGLPVIKKMYCNAVLDEKFMQLNFGNCRRLSLYQMKNGKRNGVVIKRFGKKTVFYNKINDTFQGEIIDYIANKPIITSFKWNNLYEGVAKEYKYSKNNINCLNNDSGLLDRSMYSSNKFDGIMLYSSPAKHIDWIKTKSDYVYGISYIPYNSATSNILFTSGLFCDYIRTDSLVIFEFDTYGNKIIIPDTSHRGIIDFIKLRLSEEDSIHEERIELHRKYIKHRYGYELYNRKELDNYLKWYYTRRKRHRL